MKFLWTTINVKNLDESIAFYSDLLDLKVQNRFNAGPGVEIAFMGNGLEGETLIEFVCNKNQVVNNSGTVSIGFSTDSVDRMIEIVKDKNITIIGEPIEIPALKFFFIKDPNDFTLQFVETKMK